MIFILLFFHFQNLWATNFITYQAQIIKPDGKALENNSVQFIVSYRNSLNNCTIYREMFSNVDMTSSAGLVVLKLGNGDTPIYAPRTLKEVFDNKTSVSCEEGGSQTVGITDNRILYMQFNDGSGWQTVNAMEIDSVPFAWYAEDSRKFSGLLSSDFTKKSDIPGCLAGEVLTANASGDLSCVVDSGGGGSVTSVTASGPLASSGGATPNITITQASGATSGYLSSADWTTFNNKLSNFSTMTSADVISALTFTPVNSATAVTSVAGRTGVVTLSSADISGLGNSAGLNVGTGVGTVAAGDDGRFTDERTPLNNSVTSAKIVDGTIISADIANSTITLNKLNQDSASTGQVIKWNGSAWVASSDDSGAGGTVTSVTASGPLASSGGTTPNITLVRSNGTTDGYLASTDWTTFNNKLSNFSTMTSADVISALTFTPLSNANGFITFDKFNQNSASTGQVIKWNGSAWVASSDDSGAGGTVTSVTASGPLSSSGGATPNITITQASGAAAGYLSSADWTIFSNKLSDFSTLTSLDITGKLG